MYTFIACLTMQGFKSDGQDADILLFPVQSILY